MNSEAMSSQTKQDKPIKPIKPMKTLLTLMTAFAVFTLTVATNATAATNTNKAKSGTEVIKVVPVDNPLTAAAPANWTPGHVTAVATFDAFTDATTNAVTNGIGITTQSKAGYGEITGAFTNNGHTVANTATERTAMD